MLVGCRDHGAQLQCKISKVIVKLSCVPNLVNYVTLKTPNFFDDGGRSVLLSFALSHLGARQMMLLLLHAYESLLFTVPLYVTYLTSLRR